MIREVIRPQNTNFTINIPTSYINREVEFIMFPLDEKEVLNNEQGKNRKSLRGIFNKYSDSTKKNLEDSAWQNHIMDKFKAND